MIIDVTITDLITERDLKNADSSSETGNLGAKDGDGDTKQIVAAVISSC